MFLFVFQNLLHTVRHLAREEGTKHMGQFLSVGCSRRLNIQAVMCVCPCNMAQFIYVVSLSSGEVVKSCELGSGEVFKEKLGGGGSTSYYMCGCTSSYEFKFGLFNLQKTNVPAFMVLTRGTGSSCR